MLLTSDDSKNHTTMHSIIPCKTPAHDNFTPQAASLNLLLGCDFVLGESRYPWSPISALVQGIVQIVNIKGDLTMNYNA